VITNALLDHAGLVPLALLAVAVGCVLLGWVALGSRRLTGTLLGASLLPVVALTLVPTATSRVDDVRCTVQFALPTLGSVELLANVALFLPPAFFGALVTRRPVWALAAATGASVAVETLQALVPVLGRACDTNDWLMNTLGATVGVLLAVGALAAASRRHRASAGV
jgi:hypothetical protein